jgi:hypothetical protein
MLWAVKDASPEVRISAACALSMCLDRAAIDASRTLTEDQAMIPGEGTIAARVTEMLANIETELRRCKKAGRRRAWRCESGKDPSDILAAVDDSADEHSLAEDSVHDHIVANSEASHAWT